MPDPPRLAAHLRRLGLAGTYLAWLGFTTLYLLILLLLRYRRGQGQDTML